MSRSGVDPELKTAAIRIVLTDEAAAEFARLQQERAVATLQPANGGPIVTTRRAVPVREVYELIIRAFLDRERAGEAITVLYPPESVRRRVVLIDAEVKAELEAAARRLDVSVVALFHAAARAFLDDQNRSREDETS